MEVLKNDKCNPNTRHLAGIIFKNTLLNATQLPELENLWANMNKDQQDLLKESSLASLLSEDKNIIRSASSALSAICIYEIPKGSWLDVMETLSANTTHEDENVRYASLVALGYVCEELRENELQKKESELVISAFMESLENNSEKEELIKQTISGLFH